MKKEFKVAKSGAEGAPVRSFVYEFPETLAQAQVQFSDDGLLALALAQLTIKLQAVVRGLWAKDISLDQIQQTLNSWKPGDSLRTGPSLATQAQNVEENIGMLSPEIRKALLEKLKASMKA